MPGAVGMCVHMQWHRQTLELHGDGFCSGHCFPCMGMHKLTRASIRRCMEFLALQEGDMVFAALDPGDVFIILSSSTAGVYINKDCWSFLLWYLGLLGSSVLRTTEVSHSLSPPFGGAHDQVHFLCIVSAWGIKWCRCSISYPVLYIPIHFTSLGSLSP